MSPLVAILLVVVGIQAATIVALWLDRTRRARAHEAGEERFRRIAEGVPAMIWTARPDTTLDYLNQRCAEFTGVPMARLIDAGWLDLLHPDDRQPCIDIFSPAIAARQPFVLEYRIRRADGAWRWLLDTGVPWSGPTGEYIGYVGSCIDITERRQAEDRVNESRTALQASHREIRHLAGRLIAAQDAERARVARDLHDDVSQQLAGLSIALSSLKHRLDAARAGADLREDVRAIHQRTADLAQNVRDLSHDLHPTVLRHAGLVAALAAHCAEVERTHGIPVTCRAEGDFACVAPATSLCIYRIAQEALRNVVAHAGASCADVQLARIGDDMELAVADDGRGFDLARALEQGKGLGLASIAERARLAGGSLNVARRPDRGMRVSARVPARAAASNGTAQAVEGEPHELSVS